MAYIQTKFYLHKIYSILDQIIIIIIVLLFIYKIKAKLESGQPLSIYSIYLFINRIST